MIDKPAHHALPSAALFGPTTGLLCLLPLALYGLLGGATGHDDSHISFWQAHTLLAQGELLNYNGARIEQSSSLLLVLLTAALGALTPLSLVTAGYLLNLAGAALCLWLLWREAQRAQLNQPWLPLLLTALSPYFSYWAWSGMETTLAACCALWFIRCTRQLLAQDSNYPRQRLLLAALLLALVRPEMVLLGPAFLLLTALLTRRPALLLYVLPFVLLPLWRLWYFGALFPNPVYAKSAGPGWQQLLAGVDYALRLFRHPLLAVISGISLIALMFSLKQSSIWRKQTISALCGLWVLLYASFVIASGGDWMKEGRFWVPLIAPFWLFLCTTLHGTRATNVLRYGLPLLLLSYTPFFITTFNMGLPVWTYAQQRAIAGPDASFFETASREHLRDWPALRALQQQLHNLPLNNEKPLTLMSKQMGMVNYHLLQEFAGQLRVLDMAGLTENSLRACAALAQDGFDRQGLRINYRKFFERLPQAEQDCGITAPDIIYDIYGWGETEPLPDFLARQGYTIVFHQTGRVDSWPGRDITAQEVVAMRTALLPAAMQHNTAPQAFRLY